MDLRFSAEDEAFRDEVRTFLEDSLRHDFAEVRGRGGPGDDDCLFEERLAWERHLGANGWTCVAWPKEHGGRGLSLHQQVVYFEEYARARAPGRIGHIGETLLGPTLIAFGTDEQQARFLPGIVAGTELWCQGYSEPGAGSDLANIQTRAELVDGRWLIDGQKVWTSQAHWADWCFVLARTNRDAAKHKGISYLLVPMRQDGVEIRPIHQVTGDSEFNEVFFSGATTDADHVVGDVDGGLAGGHGHARLRAGRLDPRAEPHVPERVGRGARRRPGQRPDRRRHHPPAPRRLAGSGCASCGSTRCGSCRRATKLRPPRW